MMSTTVEINGRPVHPVANLFPMMTDEELADLAADIKANGLIQPIVVDYKGLLIDGRNRAKACEIAGIKPAVRMFEGDDPRAFILSMNLKRRHMSAGQQAMAHAMIYPEPEKGGRGKKNKNSTETLGFSAMRLSQARTVLSHSRDVAMEILAGTKFLDKEYAAAKKCTVQSDAVRGKKVPVVPDKCALDALTAPSAHDPEDPKLGNETEKIGLAMQDLDWLAAGDHNHEGPGAENPEPGDTPEVIRDRQYTLQVAKALRLARQNKLAPIDPAEVRAAKAEITETHVKAACEVARAWDDLAKQLERLRTEE
jgi:ParB-like nuclease family protein